MQQSFVRGSDPRQVAVCVAEGVEVQHRTLPLRASIVCGLIVERSVHRHSVFIEINASETHKSRRGRVNSCSIDASINMAYFTEQRKGEINELRTLLQQAQIDQNDEEKQR